MIEFGIMQAKMNFTNIIDKEVLITNNDKEKKAVILPYEKYKKLSSSKNTKEEHGFEKFIGTMKESVLTDMF